MDANSINLDALDQVVKRSNNRIPSHQKGLFCDALNVIFVRTEYPDQGL